MASPNEKQSPRGQKRKHPEPLPPAVVAAEAPSMVQDDSSSEDSDHQEKLNVWLLLTPPKGRKLDTSDSDSLSSLSINSDLFRLSSDDEDKCDDSKMLKAVVAETIEGEDPQENVILLEEVPGTSGWSACNNLRTKMLLPLTSPLSGSLEDIFEKIMIDCSCLRDTLGIETGDGPKQCDFNNNNETSPEDNAAAALTPASGDQAVDAGDDVDVTALRNQPQAQDIESSTMTSMDDNGETTASAGNK